MIPAYIEDIPDILEDSVLEICEKLAYKAHGGTYVEGLWDASPSTIVAPILHEVDWQPMELSFHGEKAKRSFDSEVSDVKEYCLASGNNPFFGYVSEPPVAPAFKEAPPVGIATTALKALGTLQALMEHDGQQDQIPELNSYFCDLWGATPDELQNARYLKPNLSNRSDVDLIKNDRSKTHRIYGYENEQNYVTVTGGGYTRSTVNEQRYIDWHRINIVMRFIGTNLLMSDERGRARLWDGDFTMKFGLVTREFPLVTNCPHVPSFAGLKPTQVDPFCSEAMLYSLRYYSSDKIVNAIALRNRIADERVKLGDDFYIDEMKLAVIREALGHKRKHFTLDFRPSPKSGYDIADPNDTRPAKTIERKVTDLKMTHQISVMRACELAMMSKLLPLWKTNKVAKMRMAYDLIRHGTPEKDAIRNSVSKDVREFAGNGFGSLVWRVLKKFRENEDEATADFLKFCWQMSGDEPPARINDRNQYFVSAMRSPSAYKQLSTLLLRSWEKVIHVFNVPSLPKYVENCASNATEDFVAILSHLWKQKRDYWIGHYKQRRNQVTQALIHVPDKTDDEAALLKRSLIRYQWLTKWLPEYACKVEPDLSVWPVISDETSRRFLLQSAESYARKRNEEIEDKYKHSVDHPKNLARSLDRKLRPSFAFLALMNSVHASAKEMSRDIAHVFRKLSEPYNQHETPDLVDALFEDSLKVDPGPESIGIISDKEDTNYMVENENGLDLLAERYHVITESVQPQWGAFPDIEVEEEEEEYEGHDMGSEADLDDLAMLGMPNMVELGDATSDLAGLTGGFATNFMQNEFNFDSNFSFDFGDSATADALKMKSPLSDMRETRKRIPDLNLWADLAGVTLDELEKCSADRYDMIFNKGLEILRNTDAELEEEEEKAEYDVSKRVRRG